MFKSRLPFLWPGLWVWVEEVSVETPPHWYTTMAFMQMMNVQEISGSTLVMLILIYDLFIFQGDRGPRGPKVSDDYDY